MSNERDEGLARLREQAGGIDPVVQDRLQYEKGVEAIRKVTRTQGQVMSAALSNNAQLYETNKKLTALVRDMERETRAAVRARELAEQRLEEERAAWREFQESLGNAGGDRYRALYESACRTMTAWLHAELDPEQLQKRLDEMKAQAKEIQQMEHRATPEELKAAGVAQPAFRDYSNPDG